MSNVWFEGYITDSFLPPASFVMLHDAKDIEFAIKRGHAILGRIEISRLEHNEFRDNMDELIINILNLNTHKCNCGKKNYMKRKVCMACGQRIFDYESDEKHYREEREWMDIF